MPAIVHDLPRPTFTDPRRVSVELHHHLRRLIIDNALPAGSILKQAELARVFGISRTPMREAFRMLQEEGLIEAETNQRARVRELDLNELDQLYSVRITLESLGVRITAGRITPEEVAAAHSALSDMERARDVGDTDSWMALHRLFHGLCMARADEPLTRIIESYSERSERYLRRHQLAHPESYQRAREQHLGILLAVIEGDPLEAGSRMAEHLATSSLTVLHDASNSAEPRAIRLAVSMASVSRPAGRGSESARGA